MANKKVDDMSFLDHVEELRWHLVRAVSSVVIAATLAFIFKDFVVGIIMAPKHMDFPTYVALCELSKFFGMDMSFCASELPFQIEVRSVGGQFSAHIWTSIYAGMVVAFPYVLYQLWSFISPGLQENERKNSRGFILVASFLFFLGVAFGYYVITPLSLNFLTNYTFAEEVSNAFDLSSYNSIVRSSSLACGLVFELPIVIYFLTNYTFAEEVSNAFDLSSYNSIVRSSSLACGLVFELPIIIYFLTKVGLVTPQILRKYRKYALVVVLILSAIITPPDIASQVIVAIPILLLYQVSIYISGVVLKNQKRRERKRKTS